MTHPKDRPHRQPSRSRGGDPTGMVFDAATELGKINDLSTWDAFRHPQFWSTFWDVFPDVLPDYKTDFAIAAGFGALGAFSSLRAVFQQTAAK
jgi:hypothetical protein